jgi:hypothetical protein
MLQRLGEWNGRRVQGSRATGMVMMACPQKSLDNGAKKLRKSSTSVASPRFSLSGAFIGPLIEKRLQLRCRNGEKFNRRLVTPIGSVGNLHATDRVSLVYIPSRNLTVMTSDSHIVRGCARNTDICASAVCVFFR